MPFDRSIWEMANPVSIFFLNLRAFKPTPLSSQENINPPRAVPGACTYIILAHTLVGRALSWEVGMVGSNPSKLARALPLFNQVI